MLRGNPLQAHSIWREKQRKDAKLSQFSVNSGLFVRGLNLLTVRCFRLIRDRIVQLLLLN